MFEETRSGCCQRDIQATKKSSQKLKICQQNRKFNRKTGKKLRKPPRKERVGGLGETKKKEKKKQWREDEKNQMINPTSE